MTDYIVRATAADSQIRAFAATTREMTEYARKVHEESPVACAALGRLMTAGAMMGAMMKGDKDLLTLQIRADGPLRGMTVTADAKGNVKGFAGNPQVMLPPNALGKLDVGGAVGHGILNVIKDMGMKEPYVGQVGLQTGEIAEDLTYYFATSEQVASSVGATWEDLLAQSDYYDNNGKYLTEVACTGVRASQELLVYLAQYGLEIASAQDDGKYKNTWNDNKDELEKATKVFQFYQDLIDNKIIDSSAKNWGWEETDENFATGITSTYVTGNWLAERESSNPDTMGDVSVAPIPYPADGQPATYMECKPMFIMEGSENKDEAFDLATAFCSKEWQEAAFADRSPRSDVSTDSKWSKDFSALADTGVTFPPVTLSGINQAMVDSIAKVLQEGKTAEEAASWLSDAVNASLQENGELSE